MFPAVDGPPSSVALQMTNVLLEVFDESSLSHVDGQLAYVGHVITDPLQVLGHEKQSRVTRGGSRLAHHHFDQPVKNVVIEFVDLSVAQNYLAGRGRIAG